MKTIKIIRFEQKNLKLFLFVMVLSAFFVSVSQIFAHGGEDHSEEPKQTVSAGTKTVTQVVRAGHFEITLKHASLEPDTKTAAQIFITDYETNAPIDNAKINLIVEGDGIQKQEVAATATEMPGSLLLEIPPLPQGSVKFKVQVEAGGNSETASFGAIAVEHYESLTTSATQSSWVWTIFFWLGLILILALIGVGVWFGVRRYKAIENEESAEIESEIVSA